MDTLEKYHLIRSVEALQPYMPELLTAKVMGVDTETTGLDPHKDRLRLIQISLMEHPVLIIDCFTFLPEGISLLNDIFTRS